MSIIVEDGTGLSTAESYCTVAFADTYHDARGNYGWPASGSSVLLKEQALRNAADYMVEFYRHRWIGTRIKVDQALDWPRYGVLIPDTVGYYYRGLSYNILSNVVPVQVQQANAILALKAFGGVDLAPDLDRKTHREKVGPIEVEYELGGVQFKRFRAVDHLLQVFIGSDSSIPMVRA